MESASAFLRESSYPRTVISIGSPEGSNLADVYLDTLGYTHVHDSALDSAFCLGAFTTVTVSRSSLL